MNYLFHHGIYPNDKILLRVTFLLYHNITLHAAGVDTSQRPSGSDCPSSKSGKCQMGCKATTSNVTKKKKWGRDPLHVGTANFMVKKTVNTATVLPCNATLCVHALRCVKVCSSSL